MRQAQKTDKEGTSPLKFSGVEVSREKIAEFCQRWRITELALFGSILREDFRPDSDIDLLVTFAPDTTWKLTDWVEMKEELEAILGHVVDLVEKHLVENSPNYIRRKHILSNKQTIYVA